MRILAYHVQPYEEKAFKNWAKRNNVEVVIEKGLLTNESVELAKGFDGVTTQQVIPVKDEEIFKKLKEYGVSQISSRTAGVDMFELVTVVRILNLQSLLLFLLLLPIR